MDAVFVLLLPAVFFGLAGFIVREAYQWERRQLTLAPRSQRSSGHPVS